MRQYATVTPGVIRNVTDFADRYMKLYAKHGATGYSTTLLDAHKWKNELLALETRKRREADARGVPIHVA